MASPQIARIVIGPIVQRLDGFEHLQTGLFAHIGLAIQHATDRLEGHACFAGNINDGGRPDMSGSPMRF